MSAQISFVLQGGPGLVQGPRAKYYDGYFCLQLAENGGVELAYDAQVSRHSGPVLWISYPGPWISHRPLRESRPWRHRFVGFAGPLADAWWQRGLLPRHPVNLPDGRPWGKLLDRVLAYDLLPDDSWGHDRKRVALEDLLLQLAEHLLLLIF